VQNRQARQLVHDFYAEVCNAWSDTAVDRIFDEEFVFRGSLGDEVRGRGGFRVWGTSSASGL
jgi:hypothetical protein